MRASSSLIVLPSVRPVAAALRFTGFHSPIEALRACQTSSHQRLDFANSRRSRAGDPDGQNQQNPPDISMPVHSKPHPFEPSARTHLVREVDSTIASSSMRHASAAVIASAMSSPGMTASRQSIGPTVA